MENKEITNNEKEYFQSKKIIIGIIILVLAFLILLALPLTFAATYGNEVYGCGLYGEGCSDAVVSESVGGGGGGGLECTQNSDCAENRYCFRNDCYDAECTDDSTCNVGEGEVCWELRCVKLFDVKIIDFESPIVLGDFFDFTYFVKGMAEVNGDVIINFRIEEGGNVVSSGFDVVYFGSFEEKTETTSLFMPSDTRSGTYDFIIEVNLGTYFAQSSRTVEISVDDGVATLRLFDISFLLEDSVIESSDELSSVVTFENFGNVATSVALTFIILNEEGGGVHKGEETITVETEEILRKSFKGLDLPEGKYEIILQTLYNVDVFDEFSQNFEIKKVGFLKYFIYGSIGIVVLLIVWFVSRGKINIQITRRVALGRKKFAEKRKLSNRKLKEAIRGYKKLEKSGRDEIKTGEIDKKIKSLEKKKVLLKKGYQSGYINKESYKIDLKKINKLISGLRR
jgi:hypothetical protein